MSQGAHEQEGRHQGAYPHIGNHIRQEGTCFHGGVGLEVVSGYGQGEIVAQGQDQQPLQKMEDAHDPVKPSELLVILHRMLDNRRLDHGNSFLNNISRESLFLLLPVNMDDKRESLYKPAFIILT